MLGTVIGTYRLLEKLGEGGMGTVWIAEHTLLGRRAAIKLIHATYARDEVLIQRFLNEAKIVAAIADPGIVQVFDFGVHSDGSPYIVMELLKGETLEARLRRMGRLASREAIRLVRQVAISLSAAHDEGVIHRDLKPENLFVTRDPAVPGAERVKVLDFGIAKLSRGAGKHKTQTGAVLGTPAYMSPEQCRGMANIDHHSDIYSLGAVLFCLVTGRPPFEGEGEGDAMISHVRDQPPTPSSIASGVPAGLDAVILRCLEKNPVCRYQAMGDLAAALDGIEAGLRDRAASAGIGGWPPTHGTHGVPVAPILPPHAITTISAAPGEITLHRQSARRRWALALSGAGVLAVVIVIVIATAGSNGGGYGTPSAGFAPAGQDSALSADSADMTVKLMLDGTVAPVEALKPTKTEHAPADASIPIHAVRTAVSADASISRINDSIAMPLDASIDAARIALPADASVSNDAVSIEAPVDATLVPQPDRPQRTRDDRQPKERTTHHESDTRTGSGRPNRIDFGD